MIAPLTHLLVGALNDPAHPIESVAGACSHASDLLAMAHHATAQLREHEVGAGEPVHVRMGNRPADFASLLGIWQAGAVAVPIHVAASASTVARVQSSTRVRFVMDLGRLEIVSDAVPPDREILRHAALVIFTSGSTGEPKGVVVGHQRFADKLAVLARLLRFHGTDVVLVPLQLTFIFGLWVSLLALMARSRLVLVPKFAPETMRIGLGKGATILAAVPSMFRTLLADTNFRAPGLRMLLSGGEALPKHVAQHVQSVAPHARLYDLYGSTETGSCDFCLGPQDQPQGLGTIGNTTEGVEFRIRAVAGGEAEAGELQIRTPFGMLGYLDDLELTTALYEDGYFRTGDLARLDKSGRVALVARSKEIISRGGMKIAPLEVENLLCDHPDVAAALCVGVCDARLGETVHAIAVPRAGTRLDPVALRQWMLSRTERFKVPDTFVFKDALPLGPTGKVDRRAAAALIHQASEGTE